MPTEQKKHTDNKSKNDQTKADAIKKKSSSLRSIGKIAAKTGNQLVVITRNTAFYVWTGAGGVLGAAGGFVGGFASGPYACNWLYGVYNGYFYGISPTIFQQLSKVATSSILNFYGGTIFFGVLGLILGLSGGLYLSYKTAENVGVVSRKVWHDIISKWSKSKDPHQPFPDELKSEFRTFNDKNIVIDGDYISLQQKETSEVVVERNEIDGLALRTTQTIINKKSKAPLKLVETYQDLQDDSPAIQTRKDIATGKVIECLESGCNTSVETKDFTSSNIMFQYNVSKARREYRNIPCYTSNVQKDGINHREIAINTEVTFSDISPDEKQSKPLLKRTATCPELYDVSNLNGDAHILKPI